MSEISIFELEAQHGELLPERETLGVMAPMPSGPPSSGFWSGSQGGGYAGNYSLPGGSFNVNGGGIDQGGIDFGFSGTTP